MFSIMPMMGTHYLNVFKPLRASSKAISWGVVADRRNPSLEPFAIRSIEYHQYQEAYPPPNNPSHANEFDEVVCSSGSHHQASPRPSHLLDKNPMNWLYQAVTFPSGSMFFSIDRRPVIPNIII